MEGHEMEDEYLQIEKETQRQGGHHMDSMRAQRLHLLDMLTDISTAVAKPLTYLLTGKPVPVHGTPYSSQHHAGLLHPGMKVDGFPVGEWLCLRTDHGGGRWVSFDRASLGYGLTPDLTANWALVRAHPAGARALNISWPGLPARNVCYALEVSECSAHPAADDEDVLSDSECALVRRDTETLHLFTNSALPYARVTGLPGGTVRIRVDAWLPIPGKDSCVLHLRGTWSESALVPSDHKIESAFEAAHICENCGFETLLGDFAEGSGIRQWLCLSCWASWSSTSKPWKGEAVELLISCTHTGQFCKINADLSWTVRDVKKLLEERLAMLPKAQHLLLGDVQLANQQILGSVLPTCKTVNLSLARSRGQNISKEQMLLVALKTMVKEQCAVVEAAMLASRVNELRFQLLCSKTNGVSEVAAQGLLAGAKQVYDSVVHMEVKTSATMGRMKSFFEFELEKLLESSKENNAVPMMDTAYSIVSMLHSYVSLMKDTCDAANNLEATLEDVLTSDDDRHSALVESSEYVKSFCCSLSEHLAFVTSVCLKPWCFHADSISHQKANRESEEQGSAKSASGVAQDMVAHICKNCGLETFLGEIAEGSEQITQGFCLLCWARWSSICKPWKGETVELLISCAQTGQYCKIAADLSWTVRDIKNLLEERLAMISNAQHLLLGDMQLADHQILGSVLPIGKTISLSMARSRGHSMSKEQMLLVALKTMVKEQFAVVEAAMLASRVNELSFIFLSNTIDGVSEVVARGLLARTKRVYDSVVEMEIKTSPTMGRMKMFFECELRKLLECSKENNAMMDTAYSVVSILNSHVSSMKDACDATKTLEATLDDMLTSDDDVHSDLVECAKYVKSLICRFSDQMAFITGVCLKPWSFHTNSTSKLKANEKSTEQSAGNSVSIAPEDVNELVPADKSILGQARVIRILLPWAKCEWADNAEINMALGAHDTVEDVRLRLAQICKQDVSNVKVIASTTSNFHKSSELPSEDGSPSHPLWSVTLKDHELLPNIVVVCGLDNSLLQYIKSRPNSAILMRSQAVAMQQDLYRRFSTLQFQEGLSKIEKMVTEVGDDGLQLKMRLMKAICFSEQKDVLQKYGFQASLDGVKAMERARQELMDDEIVGKALTETCLEIQRVLAIT